MTKTDELLLEREYAGLRISFYLKIVFFLTMLGGSFSPEANYFERLYSSLTFFVVITIICLFLFLIRKKKLLSVIGIASAILDGLSLTIIVIIWYLAVGGTSITPAFLLKSTIYSFSAGLMILNSFALKPLYPAIVGIVFTLSQIAFFIFAVSIAGDMNTDNFNDHVLSNKVSYFLYFVVHIAIPFFFGSMALTFLTWIARTTVRKAVLLEKDKAQMQRYFSPGIADKITAADENFLQPGGTRTMVAVMFCDIRGFTKISESLSPEEVVELLSRYHSRMVEVIFKFNGTLDKYIGDAIMATFGTPVSSAADAENAFCAALEMRSALKEFNAEQIKAEKRELTHGIAINYGEVIAGNIGTRERLEYTVIGDTVNVASRMESLCKEYGADILISESLRDQIKKEYDLVALGDVLLKGKDNPVKIFQVL